MSRQNRDGFVLFWICILYSFILFTLFYIALQQILINTITEETIREGPYVVGLDAL